MVGLYETVLYKKHQTRVNQMARNVKERKREFIYLDGKKYQTGIQGDGSYITTRNDFKVFAREVAYWVDYFGMQNNEIETCNEQTVGFDKNTTATCEVNITGRVVLITLQIQHERKLSVLDIKRAAFHEVIEALLSDLWVLADERFVIKRELEMARHNIVRQLENSIWKEKRG